MTYVRVSLVIWLIVAGAVALGLYQVKYEVQSLEEELQQVRHDIRQDRVALHVLEAEWAYLNRPERLQRLAAKHLDMGPSGAKKVAAVTALPPRISEREETVRYASAGGDDADALPLPQAKPWSLEQPVYARAPQPRLRPESRQGEGVNAPLRQASAQVAARDTGAEGRRMQQNAGTNNKTRTTTNNNTAGQVGQSDEPERLTAKTSPPRSSPPESRAIAVGDVLIRVGVRP
jgi:cell division protein FtsL